MPPEAMLPDHLLGPAHPEITVKHTKTTITTTTTAPETPAPNPKASRRKPKEEEDDDAPYKPPTDGSSDDATTSTTTTTARRSKEKRSRFIEGSMRDRASNPPRPDLLDHPAPPPAPIVDTSNKEKRNSRFTFGLSLPSAFKFRPLALVEEVKSAWNRQKLQVEEKRRKEAYLKQYLDMKAAGAFVPSAPRPEDEDEIGMAVSTDDGAAAGASMSSARKRKRAEITSVGSEMEIHASLREWDDTQDDDGDELMPPAPPLSAKPSQSSLKPTKRNLKRQERLLKKVSNLEEQLAKAKRELDDSAVAPPVPPVPDMLPLPPPPPPPSMVKDWPKRHPLAQTATTVDDTMDTSMDEGFSMIPLAPVLNSSLSIEERSTVIKPERKKLKKGVLESPPPPRGRKTKTPPIPRRS